MGGLSPPGPKSSNVQLLLRAMRARQCRPSYSRNGGGYNRAAPTGQQPGGLTRRQDGAGMTPQSSTKKARALDHYALPAARSAPAPLTAAVIVATPAVAVAAAWPVAGGNLLAQATLVGVLVAMAIHSATARNDWPKVARLSGVTALIAAALAPLSIAASPGRIVFAAVLIAVALASAWPRRRGANDNRPVDRSWRESWVPVADFDDMTRLLHDRESESVQIGKP